MLAAELTVDDDEVQVAMEIPGMNADDFDIDVVDGMLVVGGEKRVERSSERGTFHVIQRAYGQFERTLRLPSAVEETRAKARYERGVLNVTLPKARHAKARRISVQAS